MQTIMNQTPRSASCTFDRSRRSCVVGTSVIALLLAAGIAAPALAVDRSWTFGNGNFATAGNWSPFGVPGPADTARIGNFVAVQNFTVTANQDVDISGLALSNGNTFRNNGFEIDVNGTTTVAANSRLLINGLTAFSDFFTQTLTLTGANARVVGDSGRIAADNAITIGSGGEATLRGDSELRLYPGGTFNNNGRITIEPGDSAVVSLGGGLLDLDGTSGDGELFAGGTSPAKVTVLAQGLTDAFNGVISLGQRGRINMNLTDGWEAAAGSFIEAYGGEFGSGNESRLAGSGELLLNGEVSVLRIVNPSALIISAPTTVGPNAIANLSEGGVLSFSNQTTMTGGTFNTFSNVTADGRVRFDGATDWRGTVTINGVAQQNGDATVTASTVINAEEFDLDGASENTVWDINAALTLNLQSSDISGSFGGTFDIGGGLASRLTLNLSGGPQTALVMDSSSVLNLAGSALFLNRVAGSPVVHFGETNISNSKVEITAGMIFMPSAHINFAAPTSDLRMRGVTAIHGGATFTGSGRLINGGGGEMTLLNTAALDQVGLVNQGDLRIRKYNFPEQTGLASVDRFTQEAQGTLHVRVGGYALGTGHDHLIVSGGTASLAGNLGVELTGGFQPVVGDEFVILAAVGGVSGTFSNIPVTQMGSATYRWNVIYSANSVTLRLVSVETPCPADFNDDGFLNFSDFDDFVTCFEGYGCPAGKTADFDNDGFLDFEDFDAFVLAFESDC